MKRLVIGVVLIAAVLVVAPWGIGKIAEGNVDRGLDQFVDAAPWLSVVERKYTPGWFRSSQDVTFEVLAPWFAQVAAAGSAEGATAVAQAPRFTVHNEILHGPVLWFSGVGLARVNSRLALPAELRRRLTETLGTDEPVRVSTRIGFFGGRTTTFSGEKRTVSIDKGATELSWDEFEANVSYTADFDSLELDARWPRVTMRGANGGSGEIEGIFADGTSERIVGNLYDSDLVAGFDQLKFVDADGKAVEMEDGEYRVTTSVDGDFLSFGVRIGSGAMKGASVEIFGGGVEGVHYDFTLRRLHTGTMERIVTSMKESYSKPPPAGVNAETAYVDPMKAQVVELFKHDPELVVDRIGVSTKDGDATIKGLLRCRGVGEADLAAGALGLLAKVEGDLTFEAPVKFLDGIPGAASWAEQLVAQGMLERTGGKFASRIQYAGGQLKINGKIQPIPGLGVGAAPPPVPPAPAE